MKKSVAIIGGGSAALMLAASLEEKKFDVTIYEKNFALARKFLVAGDGGFNLTHSEEVEKLITRYTPKEFLQKSLHSFSNSQFRDWLKEIGIETYIGTSKRIFPIKGIKPIEVLNKILERLKSKNVKVKTQHQWLGWDENNNLVMLHNELKFPLKADVIVFALGGASWSKTGSDGSWSKYFEKKNITIKPFQASNCAFKINWEPKFIEFAEGHSLKNISIQCEDQEKRGEVVITKFGIEGGAVYALSAQIRNQLNKNLLAEITIDLKPIFSLEEIKVRLTDKGNKSISDLLKDKLNFSDLHIALLKAILKKDEFTNINLLTKKIKQLPIAISAMAPIDEAISTVGGISLKELNTNFELKKMSHHFVIGEMADWDAPTGGYLLQACFSMGAHLAKHLNSSVK